MFALLLCFPLTTLQAGGLALPEALSNEPTVAEAWQQLQNPKLEPPRRSEASQVLLQGVSALEPAQQWSFLVHADGLDLWNADLRPVYRQLARSWEPLEARLLETLVMPPGQKDAMLKGAIRAAGCLSTSNPQLLEQLAVLLETPQLASESRAALDAITGREFGDHQAFLAWWQTAKSQTREAWLEQAHEEEKVREVEDWRRRLSSGQHPEEILLGIVHPRQPIRAMAYDALRQLDMDGLDDATKERVAEALRHALQAESDVQLRVDLLALVPQVLQGREALNPLLRALEFGIDAEREAAAGYLQLLQPLDVAWEGLLRGLEGVYPKPDDGPVLPDGHVAVRMALWSGLGTLAARGEAPDIPALEARMQAALAVENDRAVRDHILSAIGRLGGPSCFAVLQPIVLDPDEAQADRSDALIAMRGIAERTGNHQLLAELLPALLADAQPQVRRQAIASLRKLHIEGAAQLLVQRLAAEPEVVLQKAILAALAEKPDAQAFPALLSFRPSTPLREAYGKALLAQIGNDVARLDQAYQALVARYDREFAFLVMRKFPRENLTPEQTVHVERQYTVAVCERLLMVGVEQGNAASYAADAVTRLQDLRQAEPEELLWPTYLVELQLMRGEVESAVAVMTELAANPALPLTKKWELGLDALRFAAAANLLEQGSLLLAALDAAGEVPPELQFAQQQIRGIFPPLKKDSAAEEEGVPTPTAGEKTQAAGGAESQAPKMVSNPL